MYGIIHRAVRDMVIETRGEQAWAELCERGHISSQSFDPMSPYPDEQTYALVGAASSYLALPADQVLYHFGVYWVRVTAPRDYGVIFHMTGADLFEFLEGLDAMHERIVLTFTDLQMPHFSLERLDDSTARLHYRSGRQGLAPFVLGLLEGLLQHFKQDASITHVADRAQGAEHDVFEIVLVAK